MLTVQKARQMEKKTHPHGTGGRNAQSAEAESKGAGRGGPWTSNIGIKIPRNAGFWTPPQVLGHTERGEFWAVFS